MLYSYRRIVIPGRDGRILEYSYNPPETDPGAGAGGSGSSAAAALPPADPSVYLGEADGLHFRYFPDGLDIALCGPQPAEIEFTKVEALTPAQRAALRKEPLAAFMKQCTRRDIEEQVGDTLDLLSDACQLIEFATVAVCALLADRSGDVPMDESTARTYGQRAALVLKSIADGHLTLRSQSDDPQKMISTILPRYARVQQIVRDSYLDPLRTFGL